jgi:hypothetical protein
MEHPSCVEDELKAYLRDDEETSIMPMRMLVAKLDESLADNDDGAPPRAPPTPTISGVRPKIARSCYIQLAR